MHIIISFFCRLGLINIITKKMLMKYFNIYQLVYVNTIHIIQSLYFLKYFSLKEKIGCCNNLIVVANF